MRLHIKKNPYVCYHRGHKVVSITQALLYLIFFVAVFTLSEAAPPRTPEPDEEVMPTTTDPAITTFNNPHGIYFPSANRLRNQLLLFIPGTQPQENKGKAQKPLAGWFCKVAALNGYHVIYLMYPNDVAAMEACPQSSDPDAFSKFRWAIIQGGANRYIDIPRAESIENRAVKLLAYLQREHPRQRWDQFVAGGNLVWDKLAVAGQSQGGGHAAIIATRYLVSRVLCFGAPKDFSHFFNAPAKWYDSSVTPLSRYFAFNNYQDKQGCGYEELVKNIKSLGIDRFGGMADVDNERAPFHHAHSLFTNWPGKPTDSKTAHGSMLNAKTSGSPTFRLVWRYMLRAPTEGSAAGIPFEEEGP